MYIKHGKNEKSHDILSCEDRCHLRFFHHCVPLTLLGIHHPAYCKLEQPLNAEWIACAHHRTTEVAGGKYLSVPLPGHLQFSPSKTHRKSQIVYFEYIVPQSKNSFFLEILL